MRDWLNNRFVLWKVDVSSDSPEWHNIKMNNTQTLKEQCEKGVRPHISWENIYSQIQINALKFMMALLKTYLFNK